MPTTECGVRLFRSAAHGAHAATGAGERHAQIAMTLDTFSHVLPSMQRDAADKLDALFEGQVGA